MRSRPSVRATFKAAMASMVATSPGMLPKLIESGQLKREYRDHRLEWMLRSGGLDIVLEGMRKGTIRFSKEIDG
jgi:glutathione S-transferase/RNA polymerase-associated protein